MIMIQRISNHQLGQKHHSWASVEPWCKDWEDVALSCTEFTELIQVDEVHTRGPHVEVTLQQEEFGEFKNENNKFTTTPDI